MSWNLLYDRLGRIPAYRSREFEELVATLLSRLLESKFVVARSGTQASGDVRSLDGDVAIQAKNYSGKSRVDLVELEGDVSRVCRSLPSLDVYVVAVSRQDAQLRDAVDAIQEGQGLDIAVLELCENASSPLGVLCACYWQEVATLPIFSGAPPALGDFLLGEATSGTHSACIDELRREIGTSLRTWVYARKKALALLGERFGRTNTQKRFGSTIDLRQAVERTTDLASIEDWWQTGKPVLRIQGEEGSGKSWLAALAAERIAAYENTAVFWLDSREWADIDSIQALLAQAMGRIEPDAKVYKRMIRKAVARWDGQLLIVLDGANERGASEALARILSEFFDHQATYRRLRFLVTTRDLVGTPGYQPNLWTGCQLLDIGGYEDAEIEQALRKIGSPLTVDDLAHLRPIVNLPRYFTVCIQLWERLQSIAIITREIVHWEDLKAKIACSDPQVYERLGLRSTADAEEVLTTLVKMSPPAAAGTPLVAGGQLGQAFGGNYQAVRNDLLEQRFLDEARTNGARISQHHVVLGWALWLQRLTLPQNGESLTACVNRLKMELEPIPESDQRTEALFVALSLTACLDTQGTADHASLTAQRKALLICWAQSQNATLTQPRLEFWCKHDLPVYAGMLEYCYNSIFSQSSELSLVAPLARTWTSESPGSGLYVSVARTLRRWLLLSIKPELPEGQTSLQCKGHELPLAESPGQLRLSAVALSILSCRADPSLLDAVALCLATCNESLIIPDGQDRVCHIKAALDTNVRALIRWGYGARCLPKLAEIVPSAAKDDSLANGAKYLAWMTGEERLPTELAEAKEWVKTTCSATNSERLRDDRTVLLPKGKGLQMMPGTGALAVRGDLPQLSDAALAELVGLADEAIAQGAPRGKASGFRREEIRQLLPWLHSRAPEKGIQLCESLLMSILGEGECEKAALDISLCPPYTGEFASEVQANVVEQLDRLFRHFAGRPKQKSFFEKAFLWEVALFCLSEEWLGPLIESHWEDGNATLTNVRIMRALAPKTICVRAHEKCQELLVSILEDGGVQDLVREFCRWCGLWGMSLSPPDSEAFVYAFHALLAPGTPAECIKPLIELGGASGVPDGLQKLLLCEQTRKLLSRENIWTFFWNSPDSYVPSFDFTAEQIAQLAEGGLAKEYLGFVLSSKPQSSEFRRWGEELMLLAAELCRSKAPSVEHRCPTQVNLDKRGAVVTNPQSRPYSQTTVSPNVAYWATEYPGKDEDGLQGVIAENESEHAAWRRDAARLRGWEGFPFHGFAAYPELLIWAATYPTRFTELAHRYLDSMPDRVFGEFHMHLFTLAVLAAMADAEPKEAYDKVRRLRGNGRIGPTSSESIFIQHLWNVDKGSTSAHEITRRATLLDCRNDQELMAMAIFAQSAKGGDTLLAVCRDLLARVEARERNMALSLLPWLCNDAAIGLIAAVKEHDQNRWVREHASWAYEAAQQDRGCRDIYREALRANDAARLFSSLYVIRPALMATARFWHTQIEKELADLPWRNNRRIRAMLTGFWEHWDNSSSSWQDTECNGRRLTDYFCGEKLQMGVHDRMAPWWKVG